jgi:hypothetical protein
MVDTTERISVDVEDRYKLICNLSFLAGMLIPIVYLGALYFL